MEEIMAVGEEPQELINENWLDENDRIIQAILFNQFINLPNENDRINPIILFHPLIKVPIELELPVEMLNQVIPVQQLVQNNEERPEDCKEFPSELIQYFQGIPYVHRNEILIDIQQLIDAGEMNISEGVNQRFVAFSLMHRVRHAALYGDQIRQYIYQPILGRFVYYLLIINQHDEVMRVVNRNNGREFLKAYRRITNDGTSESPKQAVVRVFNQQIRVENLIAIARYAHVDFDEQNVLGPCTYFECRTLDQHNVLVHRGLFIFRTNMNILAFTPRDENIFQAIRFDSINDIPEDAIGWNRDIYRTLQNLPRD